MRIKLLIFFLSIFSFFIFFSPNSFAQEKINLFNSSLSVDNAGIMTVTEQIQYDFGAEQRHGIFRYIPKTQKISDDLYKTIEIKVLDVKRDGVKENYEVNRSAEKINIKIGKSNETITGSHNYTLIYQVKNVTGNFDDHDEIYWNVTGNDWQVSINKVENLIKATFPTEITESTCFTGREGSSKGNCEKVNENINHISTTTSLSPSEGLTVVYAFPPNTFPKSKLTSSPPGKTFSYIFIAIVLFLIFIFYLALPLALLIYYLKRRKNYRFGPPTVNFEIPKAESNSIIPPAEAGTIDTTRLDRNDVIGTIFDLAIKGYIKIKEVPKKKNFLGLGGKNDYELNKIKNYKDQKLERYEITLLDKLFENGESILISDIPKDFYKTFQQLEKDIFSSLIKKGYYTKNPKTQLALFIFLAIASLVSFNLFLTVIFFIYAKRFNGRTKLGDEIDYKIDGLKLFLKSMDRNYKWHAEQLVLFEKMIPYAVSLGYIEKFMEQLKIVKPDYDPNWYTGKSPFYLSTNAFYSSMNTGIATNAPSSSSGFSGGSSGGGSGGGGGGSW